LGLQARFWGVNPLRQGSFVTPANGGQLIDILLINGTRANEQNETCYNSLHESLECLRLCFILHKDNASFPSLLVTTLIRRPRLILVEVDPSWTTPITPFRIADNLYYVGSQDLASYLVVTSKGNILINANLATSPSQMRTSVEALGFRWNDTKILLNSQAHFNHVAGAAEVIRETHAKNMVMDGDVSVVETGARADFLSPSPNRPCLNPLGL
jgi:hypothetical protein